ncbi:MAG TPA: nitroreductase family protein [Oscillospiraceae bacterium]|nr:nitroreductase family protein [Oscillospiraceae bacterium]
MLYDLVHKTRSYRNFDPSVKYSSKEMEEIINLCRFTPSTANKQSVKFAYACDEKLCEKVFPLLRWAGYLSDKPPYNGNVPSAYILLCYDLNISKDPIEIDVGICAQTIVLGAMEKGIGACMIGSFDKKEMSKIFGLSDNLYPRLIIALGEPNEKIVITDLTGEDIKYYRDEEKTHYVPKRTLDEIIIK